MSNASTAGAHAGRDVNATFRGSPRAMDWLGRINKASIVMLAETGIVADDIAAAIARGVQEVDAAPGDRTSGDYLDYEKKLAERVGPNASLVHAGRSRQDIASTLARMNLREDLLDTHTALTRIRGFFVALAAPHRDTLIPAYTHGVQAQPTTFAHYLLAFSSAWGRQLERLEQIHRRVNACTLGAAALSTSSFPLDRRRLAELLGFDDVVENGYDANHLAPVDSSLEFAGALAVCAIQIGEFAQDLHAQYASPTPWLTLRAGELMGVSSLMPQKRNPAALEQLRAQSSLLLSELQGPFLVAHNVRTGMFDYRAYEPVPIARTTAVLGLLEKVITSLAVDKEQARAEVDADYSTVTEIADVLMQKANVPFRIGHHFASDLTDYGRARRLRLTEITYAQADQLYREKNGAPLPLDEASYLQCTDPARMVSNRQGLGGPQPAEIDRMLAAETHAVRQAQGWNSAARQRLRDADTRLNTLVGALSQTSAS
jgi:argininosuccinate lyase